MRRRWWIALLAGGVAVLLGIGVTAFVLVVQARQASRPEAIVAHYLTLVERGRIQDAMRMEGRVVAKKEVLLTDAVYARAKEKLSGFRILGVDRVDANRVRVDAETRAGSHTERAAFTLQRHGWTLGELVGVTAWQLRPAPLGRVHVQVGAPEAVPVTVAGEDLRDPLAPHDFAAFPGRYTVAATVDTPWFTIPAGEAVVPGFDTRGSATPSAELTEKGRAAALAAADSWVQTCLRGGPQPQGCSFGLEAGAPEGEQWTDPRWTLVASPALTVSAWSFNCDGSAEVWGCWPVATASAGSAEFSAGYSKPATGESGTITMTEPVEVNVEGAITGFSDAGATFTSIHWK